MAETLNNKAGERANARPPRHIAIILDGNGRWAKKRGLPRTAGHAVGSGNASQNRNILQKYKVQNIARCNAFSDRELEDDRATRSPPS